MLVSSFLPVPTFIAGRHIGHVGVPQRIGLPVQRQHAHGLRGPHRWPFVRGTRNPLDVSSPLGEYRQVLDPGRCDPPSRGAAKHIRILQLSAAALQALADGDLAAANAGTTVPVTAYLAGLDCRGLWRRRSEQVQTDSGSAATSCPAGAPRAP